MHLVDSEDTLIWNFDSKGVYTDNSFYKVINFRGVLPVNTTAVCSEAESCKHLFFERVVSVELWRVITNLTGFRDDPDMISVSNWWYDADSRAVANTLHAASLWAL